MEGGAYVVAASCRPVGGDTCQDFGAGYPNLSLYEANCALPDYEWSNGPCDLTGAAGGCLSYQGGGPSTQWFFVADAGAAEADCIADGETWRLP